MNKKAQFDVARKSIYWTIAIALITMVVLAFVYIMADYKNRLTYVPQELKAELIALRFANIPDCFAYYDKDAGKVSPGVIDINKFNKEQINKCYWTEKEQGFKDYNFGLVLEEQNLKVSTINFFNKVDFTIYKEVLVKKGNHLLKDRLAIEVQVKI